MRNRKKMNARSTRFRSGFTLVEMLVVIAIIGIVVSLVAAGTMQVIGSQRNTQTENVIRGLSGLIERHWRVVIDEAKNEQLPTEVIALAEGNERRARVIWIKLRLKQEFPTNLSEIVAGPYALPAAYTPLTPPLRLLNQAALDGKFGSTRRYRQILSQAGITTGSDDPRVWPFESSVCLLMALQQSRRGIPQSADNLSSAIMRDWNPTAPATVTRLKMLVDAFDNPVVFYRWPMGNYDPAAPQGFVSEVDASNPARVGTTSARFRDSLDPEGLLMDPDPVPPTSVPPHWNSWRMYTNTSSDPQQRSQYFAQGVPAGVWWFEQYCHPIHSGWGPEPTYRPISTFTAPVLVSTGKDKRLGLIQQSWPAPPVSKSVYPSPLLPDLMSQAIAPDTYDNIYSFRLREGARGD